MSLMTALKSAFSGGVKELSKEYSKNSAALSIVVAIVAKRKRS